MFGYKKPKTFIKFRTRSLIKEIFIEHSTEAASSRCSVKKVYLEVLQNSQENTCVRISFLIKLKINKQLY